MRDLTREKAGEGGNPLEIPTFPVDFFPETNPGPGRIRGVWTVTADDVVILRHEISGEISPIRVEMSVVTRSDVTTCAENGAPKKGRRNFGDSHD